MMWVEVRKIWVPALRPCPWKWSPAASVWQVVAVRLPPVVVPEGETRIINHSRNTEQNLKSAAASLTQASPFSPHAFVLRADVSGRRKPLSAAAVIVPPPLAATVPVPETNRELTSHSGQTCRDEVGDFLQP